MFERYKGSIDSIYLYGSYGRGEGCYIDNKFYNDIDLLVVVKEDIGPVAKEEVLQRLKLIFDIKWVDIDYVFCNFFPKQKSSCFSLDLVNGSSKVYGDIDHRELMNVKGDNIGLADVQRLFLTRGWCCIGIVALLSSNSISCDNAKFFRYQAAKMAYAAIDMFLIRSGRYTSSYAAKLERALEDGLDLSYFSIDPLWLHDTKTNPSDLPLAQDEAFQIYMAVLRLFVEQYTSWLKPSRLLSFKIRAIFIYVFSIKRCLQLAKNVAKFEKGKVLRYFMLLKQTLLIFDLYSYIKSGDFEGILSISKGCEKLSIELVKNK